MLDPLTVHEGVGARIGFGREGAANNELHTAALPHGDLPCEIFGEDFVLALGEASGDSRFCLLAVDAHEAGIAGHEDGTASRDTHCAKLAIRKSAVFLTCFASARSFAATRPATVSREPRCAKWCGSKVMSGRLWRATQCSWLLSDRKALIIVGGGLRALPPNRIHR